LFIINNPILLYITNTTPAAFYRFASWEYELLALLFII